MTIWDTKIGFIEPIFIGRAMSFKILNLTASCQTILKTHSKINKNWVKSVQFYDYYVLGYDVIILYICDHFCLFHQRFDTECNLL